MGAYIKEKEKATISSNRIYNTYIPINNNVIVFTVTFKYKKTRLYDSLIS